MKTFTQFALILLVTMGMQAQEVTITGKVSVYEDSLAGVNVIVKGTTNATSTDFEGYYEIKASKADILIFSYVGFLTKEIIVGDSKIIDVVLEEDSALDEVVIIAAGVKREKRALGYAVSEVASKDVSRTLSGKVSGVYIEGAAPIAGIVQNDPAYGQLTAGEINDLEKWSEYKEIFSCGEAEKIAKRWGFDYKNKVEIHIRGAYNVPVSNTLVALYKNNEVVMKGRTDIFGNVTLFKGGITLNDRFLIQVYRDGQVVGKGISGGQKSVDFTIDRGEVLNSVDVMFTVDATGSMGDEIAYLKSELKNIMNRIDTSVEQKRVALTFYRDHGDQYVTREIDFTENIDEAKIFLSQQYASGGGDYEEAVEEALKVSLAQSWNENAKAKLMFLLLDAPPHFTTENVATIKAQIKEAQKKGIKIIPVVASGANKEVEFLMRSFSVATNGTYVFLTDDSGIGNDHIEATTEEFKVEKLNDLIVRLIEKYAGVNKDA